MRRVAAVDYGRRRIGLAISDPLGVTVRGLETVLRGRDLEEAARFANAAAALTCRARTGRSQLPEVGEIRRSLKGKSA